ncbi:VOC family protein [Coralliovum pocilloporae]|uniref:VOC family protein n=1 Tax=Coralliovum pocilloporae TaxID=3066369 RepID=UPI003307122E
MLDVRGLDHVVLAVQDLDRAAERYEALGFSVTPRGEHPWGTANRLVQLDGFFFEILTADRPNLIADGAGKTFSFGGFNRDVLARYEGGSMLVVESRDAAKDRSDFETLALDVCEPFGFEREAVGPDGSVRKVAFDLTFVRDALSPDMMFFTCHNLYPENFWKSDYQTHANGACSVTGVVLTAAEPASHHEFLGGFSGQREMRATSLGLELETPRGQIAAVTPSAAQVLYGLQSHEQTGEGLFLQAIRVGVRDLAALCSIVEKSGIGFSEFRDTLVIQPADLFGTGLIFEQV